MTGRKRGIVKTKTRLDGDRFCNGQLESICLSAYLEDLGPKRKVLPETVNQWVKRIAVRDEEGKLTPDGIMARNDMFEAFSWFVVGFVFKKYAWRDIPNFSVSDLIQEGNFGLIRAIEKYDPRRANGGTFGSYAFKWIWQSISRAIKDKSKTIRMPVHRQDEIARMFRADVSFCSARGYKPSEEELAEVLGITPQRVRKLREESRSIDSIERKIGEDDDEIGEVYLRDGSPSVEELVEQELLVEWLNEAMLTLSEEEAMVVRKHFGLDEEASSMAIIAAADARGRSKTAMQYIEIRALEKLRGQIS